jgi:hypothetical protein
MNTLTRSSRILGIAFLFQFITSFSSGVFLRKAWYVTGNMSETLLKIANHTLLFRANILVDMLTALGVTFLGAMLYITLRKEGEKSALVAMAFYFLEGALLAASRIGAIALLRLSQEYTASGQPVALLLPADVAFQSMQFLGSTLSMLAFCGGGILFYYLLDKSRLLPRILTWWGLIAVFPCLVGTLGTIFGFTVPFAIYFPYIPFELVIGVWILIKGIPSVLGTDAIKTQPQFQFQQGD